MTLEVTAQYTAGSSGGGGGGRYSLVSLDSGSNVFYSVAVVMSLGYSGSRLSEFLTEYQPL